MHHTSKKLLKAPVIAAVLLVLAAIGLAACGGSSGSSTTASTSASAAITPSGGRFATLRKCLQEHGITLPRRGQRAGGPGGGLFLGGARQLPPGVSRSQLEAGMKACGAPRGAFGRGRRLSSPAYQQQLAKFSACMRANGVNLPPPNTSGRGPIFNTGGLDTTSAKFTAAMTKCRPLLRPPGVPQPGAAGGATG